MSQIEIKFGGNELAKVLHYYGFEPEVEKIICPFHEDVNPSMTIDYETGTCHCFGCEITFNAFNFVQNLEKISDDLDACKRYIQILRSKKVKKIKASTVTKLKQNSKQLQIEAEDYYYGLSQTNWEMDKSIEVATVRDYMLKRGFTAKTLSQCKAKVNYNQSYPIIFPMLDNGEFKGWVCRTNLKTIEKKRKYLYNEGFSRRTTLCGTYKSKIVVIVEGYMDRLKLNQYGLTNVVAILGWKITAQQIEKLKDAGVEHIISALDTDSCGVKGTAYLKHFFKVTRFQFPEGVKDPGDLTKEQFDIAYKETKKIIRR